MNLLLRLLRALLLFGVIFFSYLSQWFLVRLLRRIHEDPETRRETVEIPPFLEARRRTLDQRNARRLLAGMLRLRGVYIKLGQVLSIMGGFLPRAFTRELESLQDQVPPHSFEDIERVFVASLGKKPDECFRDIAREPIAAASLGQVHVAHLHDGTKVAVKVLYPGIRDIVRVDMRVVGLALAVYKWFVPMRNLERAHASLADLCERETNYLHEAACMERMAKNFEDEPDIVFPRVVHELTTRDVLTMTFMEGVKITRFDQYDGLDRSAVATRLIQSFYKQLFMDRYFHADPHPGNFLVLPGPSLDEPRIVVLDFGAISEVRPALVDGLLDVLQGFFAQDTDTLLRGFYRMGFAADRGNRALIERTVITYFKKLLQMQERTPGALMRANPKELERLADPEVARDELRELMGSFEYPEDWFYVERACVLMFWLCGQIDPELDTMQVGFPYVLPLVQARAQAGREAEANG